MYIHVQTYVNTYLFCYKLCTHTYFHKVIPIFSNSMSLVQKSGVLRKERLGQILRARAVDVKVAGSVKAENDLVCCWLIVTFSRIISQLKNGYIILVVIRREHNVKLVNFGCHFQIWSLRDFDKGIRKSALINWLMFVIVSWRKKVAVRQKLDKK